MVANSFLDSDACVNAILQAAQTHNVNPYYIVARIFQEQRKDGSVLSKGQGYNGQYVGVYNVFNIGASGNGKETVILNGLKKAQEKGYLIDTCLAAQDQFKVYLDYFRIKYDG